MSTKLHDKHQTYTKTKSMCCICRLDLQDKSVMDGSCFKLKLVLLKFCILASHIVSNVNVPATVTRRLTGDIFYDNLSNYYICRDDNKLIILVSERRCVENQELLKLMI